MLVAMNSFALRQTPESPYSHYQGSFDALCALVERHLDKRIVLASDEVGEVVKVTLPGDAGEGFCTGMVQAEPGMAFRATYEARKGSVDEHPYFNIRALGGLKVPAVEADIILYSHSKLARKNEQSTDAAWEVVSINAKRITGDEPPHPVTMMRNQKDYPGGTRSSYTPEQWADAVEYWLGGGPVAPFVMLDA